MAYDRVEGDVRVQLDAASPLLFHPGAPVTNRGSLSQVAEQEDWQANCLRDSTPRKPILQPHFSVLQQGGTPLAKLVFLVPATSSVTACRNSCLSKDALDVFYHKCDL